MRRQAGNKKGAGGEDQAAEERARRIHAGGHKIAYGSRNADQYARYQAGYRRRNDDIQGDESQAALSTKLAACIFQCISIEQGPSQAREQNGEGCNEERAGQLLYGVLNR